VRLSLLSTSRSGDAGYLAAKDLAEIAATLEVDYRLVGGNAVSLLVAASGAASTVPGRETADADFGAAFEVIGDPRLPAVGLVLEGLCVRRAAPRQGRPRHLASPGGRGRIRRRFGRLADRCDGEGRRSHSPSQLRQHRIAGAATCIG
jgi:hypothetical protein